MSENLLEVSKRIREMREIMEMTEQQVADSAGLTREEYADYESGRQKIPVSALYAVASAFGVDPTVLMTGEQPRMDTYTITRKGKGISVERYKEYTFSALAYNFINRFMDPMIVELLPKDSPPELVTHRGQEFNYVLEGTVVVILGHNRFSLNEGDSVYFDPNIPHGQMASGGPAKFLTVIME